MMEYDEFLVMMNDITQKIPEELNNNRELVIDVVHKNGLTLQYASDDIKTMQSLAVGQEVQEHYDHDAQIPKVKRFSYAKIKELYTEAQAIRSELHKTESVEFLNRLDAFIDEITLMMKSRFPFDDCNMGCQ